MPEHATHADPTADGARAARAAEQPARRPIKSRGSAWARWLARRLCVLGVTPNAISIASVAWAVVGGVLLAAATTAESSVNALLFIGAIVCIAARSICNLIDGMVAIEGGRATPSGPVFNEFPDRISDAAFLVGAGFATTAMPWGEHIGWLAALLAVLTAYTRSLGAAQGAGDDFSGPMAKPTRMALLAIGCAIAAAESLAGREPVAVYAAILLITAGCIVTTARRLHRVINALEHAS